MVYMVCDCVCSYSRLLSGYVLLYALLHACFGVLIVLGLVLLLFDFTVILVWVLYLCGRRLLVVVIDCWLT